jgi:hypothetical protein
MSFRSPLYCNEPPLPLWMPPVTPSTNALCGAHPDDIFDNSVASNANANAGLFEWFCDTPLESGLASDSDSEAAVDECAEISTPPQTPHSGARGHTTPQMEEPVDYWARVLTEMRHDKAHAKDACSHGAQRTPVGHQPVRVRAEFV